MFAKQLPKILEGLGIKLDGGFQLNPLKKIEKEALGGDKIAKVAKKPVDLAKGATKGVGTAALVGGAAVLTGQGLRGMGKAFLGGVRGQKFGKNFSSSYSAARARKKQVDQMKLDGVKPSQVRSENLKNKFKGVTAKDEYDDFSSSIKAIQDNYKNYYGGVLGADKVAKEFDRRRLAAENAGDHAGMKFWQDAIDARVKEVQNSKGQIALNSVKDSSGNNVDYAAIIADDMAVTGTIYGSPGNGFSEYMDTYLGTDADKKALTFDKGLVNIKSNNDKIIDHVNKNYNRRFDYAGELKTSDDFKTINGKSKSVSRAADSSSEARKLSDLYKYTNQSKK